MSIYNKSGVICLFLCALVYSFITYSGNEQQNNIDIPHITITIMPIFIVLAILLIYFFIILNSKPKIHCDFILGLLFIRIFLHMIPLFYIIPSKHFMVNYITSLLCIVFYIIGMNFSSDERFVAKIIKLILIILCVQTIMEAKLGTCSYFGNTYYYKHDLVIPIGGSNAIVSKITPLYAFVICSGKNRINNILITLLVLFAVILTKSRSGIITVLLIISLVWTWNGNFGLKKKLSLITIIVIMGGVLYKFITMSSIGYYVFSNSDSTVLGRIELWKEGIQLFFTHPVWGSSFSNEVINNNPHNYLIDILMRSGLIGMILFLIIIFKFANISRKYVSDSFVRGCLCFAVCMLIQGLVEVVLFSYIPDMFLWFMLGTMMCRIKNLERKSDNKKNDRCFSA